MRARSILPCLRLAAVDRPRALRGALLSICVLVPACGEPAKPVVVTVEREAPAPPPPDPAEPLPRVDPRRSPASREPEPRAVAAREAAIRRDLEAIEAECRTAAGGDWDRWERQTAGYRAALKARIDRLKEYDPPPGPWPEVVSEALEGADNFPLFEVGPRASLEYLYRPEVLDNFRRRRTVVLAHRWLRDRGIDLLFVPAPRMMEVYNDRFLDPAPPDGVVAPHVRRTLYELLKEGVEVVDTLPLLRALRDADAEYLYNTADTHWAPRAMRIAAKEIAGRLERYQFGASARYSLPIVKSAPDQFYVAGPPTNARADAADTAAAQYGWLVLSPEQQARARLAQTSSQARVTLADGRAVPSDPHSPVLLIGNSFAMHFQDQLVKELNLLVNARWTFGGSTEMFGDFLREPGLLDHCKVVVWMTSTRHLEQCRPLPAKIAAAGPANQRPE